MKKIFLSIFCLFILVHAHATIRRVGANTTPVPNIDFSFTSFQAAINAANPGDTIQVYQQLNTTLLYVNANVDKPLKIIGFGHTLNVNTGSQIQNQIDSSSNALYNLTFASGSAGSSVQGLNISYCSISDSNITIKRCRFRSGVITSSYNSCVTGSPFLYPNDGGTLVIGAYSYNLKNITINACYFDRAINANNITYGGSYATTNLIITNNYFNGSCQLHTGTGGQIYGVFANNIVNYQFQHLSNAYSYNGNSCPSGTFPYSFYYKSSAFDYFMIKNNIFNSADTTSCTLVAANSIIQNNIFTWASQYACPSASSSNNIFKANMATVFSAAWAGGMVYNDNQLALGVSSAAINAGIKENLTTTNCGVFGGETGQDYKLSGIPSVPSFYLLSTPSVNATTNPFNVTFSVKSNN